MEIGQRDELQGCADKSVQVSNGSQHPHEAKWQHLFHSGDCQNSYFSKYCHVWQIHEDYRMEQAKRNAIVEPRRARVKPPPTQQKRWNTQGRLPPTNATNMTGPQGPPQAKEGQKTNTTPSQWSEKEHRKRTAGWMGTKLLNIHIWYVVVPHDFWYYLIIHTSLVNRYQR